MNRATIASPALRSLSEVLEHFQDRVPAAEIARRLNLSTSTISRDRKDKPILTWSFEEVMVLARSDEMVGRAMRDFLDGAVSGTVLPDPKRFTADFALEISASARLHATVIEAMADGKIDARERALIREGAIDCENAIGAVLKNLEAMDAREAVTRG